MSPTKDGDELVGRVVLPGQGHHLVAGSTRPTVKVGPSSGSRLIGLLESEVLPGGGFPAHVHDEYEEVFYVVAGQIEYLVAGTWTPTSAGTTVFVPPGLAHGFRNVTDQPARHLAITSPAIAVRMVEELLEGSREQASEIFARYASRWAP